MKKSLLISMMLLSFLLVLSACGNKAEVGMNKISIKELEEKLDKDESFLLVTFSASEEEVEKSELVEAFDESLNNEEQTAFYVNFDGETEETLVQLGEKYTPSGYKGDVWEPENDGLVLIKNGDIEKKTRETLVSKKLIETTSSFLSEWNTESIEGGLSEILEYVEGNNVELTYN